MKNTLNQKIILESFPFTVKKVFAHLKSRVFYINLTNHHGDILTLSSNDLWQIVTPSQAFGSEYHRENQDDPRIASYIEALGDACDQLVGTQITNICGYHNLYDNTFIFSNGFIVRFMTAGDDWVGELGTSVKLETASGVVQTEYSSPRYQRLEYFPQPLITSPENNPFDRPLSLTNQVLIYAIGSTITNVLCMQNDKLAAAAYSLLITLQNGSEIVISNAWTVNSSTGVWCSQQEFHEIEGLKYKICAKEYEQMAEHSIQGAKFAYGEWLVANEVGTFKR
ncbi:hypothetical protein [Rothia nasisuis]|uniref:hypothetical protein n=1 Tax=Rothia nasisuis TaxID=2109647 RepID=UPI001F1EBDDF|nr:hypothetical protein [Rothia nasisuis]